MFGRKQGSGPTPGLKPSYAYAQSGQQRAKQAVCFQEGCGLRLLPFAKKRVFEENQFQKHWSGAQLKLQVLCVYTGCTSALMLNEDVSENGTTLSVRVSSMGFGGFKLSDILVQAYTLWELCLDLRKICLITICICVNIYLLKIIIASHSKDQVGIIYNIPSPFQEY